MFLLGKLMPDLITHSVAAYMIRNRKIEIDFLVIYLLGAILPDIVTRPFMIIFPQVSNFFHAFHTPTALILIVLLLSLFFESEIRPKVFKLLALGTLTHLFLDLFQNGVGDRGYSWFFPFSYYDFRIGLFWPEDSISILPLVISIFIVDYFVSRKSQKL